MSHVKDFVSIHLPTDTFYVGATVRSPEERWVLKADDRSQPSHCDVYSDMYVLLSGHAASIAEREVALIRFFMEGKLGKRVAWQWGVVLVVRGVSAWAPRRFCTGHVARGANLFGHEMVPDSSSWAGARDVSARAPSCEVMKQIFDQSLGCAILFKTATKHYYHYRHYYYYYYYYY